MKKNWGKGGSKEDVECSYCGEVVRKDNLERHTRNKHQGKKSSWRPRLISGQQSIFAFAQSRVIPGTSFRDCCNKERADEQSQSEKDTDQDHLLEADTIFQNDNLQSIDLVDHSNQEESPIEVHKMPTSLIQESEQQQHAHQREKEAVCRKKLVNKAQMKTM